MSSIPIEPSDEVAVRAVNKRYEGLVAVRRKAVKGKGAWYWAHLEPILIRNPETNAPNAVKLKCTLCDVAFSASNPSRTASEHLKRGACPNFEIPPLASQKNHRKRSPQPFTDVYPISMIDSSRVLSGGQDDLGPLALLEDSVKKLKSPKSAPCSSSLTKNQVNKACENLSDWFMESCGTVSFSSLQHPKFRAFLNQVGLPPVPTRELLTARLDYRFDQARSEADARISDAAFFQVASNGWKNQNQNQRLVKFTVNLPNGTTVFQRAVYCDGASLPPEYAQEVLWETARGICGSSSSSNARRCVGIVSDKYKAKALRNLEHQNQWMVNLSCQLHAFFSLIKDLCIQLPLFKTVSDNCMKIANLINSTPQIRSSLHKFRLQGLDVAVGFIRVPPPKHGISKCLGPFVAMLDDLLSCSRILHLIVLDDSYKDDISAREVADIIQDVGFWNDVEAVHSLVKMIMGMGQEIESERPLIGQCLPLWVELRTRVKSWCSKYNIAQGPVEKILETRFKKNYHPAWSAAYILDPLYLIKEESGKYLPPFRCLTNEQEKDVDKLVMRLVSREEAHIVLMELMKWRSEGLDPLYAQAVQVKQRDPVTGKMKIANPQSSRLVWETCLKDFKLLSEVAVRLLFLHATVSCGIKYDWSFTKWFCRQGHSRSGLETAQKLAFVTAHAKLVRRREYSSAEENDVQLYGEDDMFNQLLLDTPSV